MASPGGRQSVGCGINAKRGKILVHRQPWSTPAQGAFATRIGRLGTRARALPQNSSILARDASSIRGTRWLKLHCSVMLASYPTGGETLNQHAARCSLSSRGPKPKMTKPTGTRAESKKTDEIVMAMQNGSAKKGTATTSRTQRGSCGVSVVSLENSR